MNTQTAYCTTCRVVIPIVGVIETKGLNRSRPLADGEPPSSTVHVRLDCAHTQWIVMTNDNLALARRPVA